MRQEEEKTTLELLRQESGPSSFLQPPSPSQGTATSPSPSYASTTHSMTEAMNDMEVATDQPRPRKQRAGRHGPLPMAKKLRAALVRKLGACEACRERRVGCSHHDLSLFEDAYQKDKRAADLELVPDLGGPSTTPYQPRFSDSQDLVGVGIGQNVTNFSSQGFQAPREETYVEFDPLLETPQPQRRRAVSNPSSLYIFGGSRLPALHLSPQNSTSNVPPASQSPQPIAIGKQVNPYGPHWDCAWGHDGATSSVSSGGLEPCHLRFNSFEALQTHFTYAHTPFHKPWYMWQCPGCELQSPDSSGPCMQCLQNTPRQLWYWANRSSPPTLSSVPMGRVTSADGFSSNRYPWSNNYSSQFFGQSGSFNNNFTFSFGGYGNGSGSGQSYHKAATTSQSQPPKPAPTRCSNTPLTTACQSNSGHCSALIRLASYSSDGITKSAFPHVVISISFLALLVVERCRFAVSGQSWAVNVPELSVVCVLAGLGAASLWRHARFRLLGERVQRRGEGGGEGLVQRHERCYMRDLINIPQLERDMLVGAVES